MLDKESQAGDKLAIKIQVHDPLTEPLEVSAEKRLEGRRGIHESRLARFRRAVWRAHKRA